MNKTKDKIPNEDHPYESLLHMIWNPIEERFYKHVALQPFNIRENPRSKLPDNSIVYLGAALCKSEFEEVIDYEKFLESMK